MQTAAMRSVVKMPEVAVILAEKNIYTRSKEKSFYFEKFITDWETISEEDYHELRNNMNLLKPPYGYQYTIITRIDIPAIELLDSIKDKIAARKAEEEEKHRIKSERAKLAAEKRKKKQEAEERKLLKQLKSKYEEDK